MIVTFNLATYDPESAGLAHAKFLILRDLGFIPDNGIADLVWPDPPESPTPDEIAILRAYNIRKARESFFAANSHLEVKSNV